MQAKQYAPEAPPRQASSVAHNFNNGQIYYAGIMRDPRPLALLLLGRGVQSERDVLCGILLCCIFRKLLLGKKCPHLRLSSSIFVSFLGCLRLSSVFRYLSSSSLLMPLGLSLLRRHAAIMPHAVISRALWSASSCA